MSYRHLLTCFYSFLGFVTRYYPLLTGLLFSTILAHHNTMKVQPSTMLSLSTENVSDYWQQMSPELGRLFSTIEKTEDWTLDNNPDIGERLTRLGLQLADPEATRRLAAADKNEFLFFLVYISSSKALRLIQWMDSTQNGLGTQCLNALLERDSDGSFANVLDPMLASTMLQRLRVIQNTPFFQKLFDPSMLDSISRAIENYQEEKEKHET